jgi:hypothetical protein
MEIEVYISGKTYGGYTDLNGYEVRLDYDDFDWNAGDEIDFAKYKDIAKQVEASLLGKRATGHIVELGSNEVIVYKGETIAKLHVQKILENWGTVDFGMKSLSKKLTKSAKNAHADCSSRQYARTQGVT